MDEVADLVKREGHASSSMFLSDLSLNALLARVLSIESDYAEQNSYQNGTDNRSCNLPIHSPSPPRRTPRLLKSPETMIIADGT